jgi:DNA replication protein DnaC
MLQLSRSDLLVLDDWGLAQLTADQRYDLLEILEDRHAARSTPVTSQVPVEQWHELIADATPADAIPDRPVHTAHRIKLKGESMRKQKAALTQKVETK